MKKLISLCLAALLVAALAACTQNAPSSSASQSVPAPPPVSSTPEPPPAPTTKTSTLTGLEVPLDYAAGKRMGAVVVGNISHVRPVYGLSGAEVLFELPVEGGITRYLAFYEDYAAMPDVGPVRSSRDGFLQLAMPWQPLLVCAGGGQMHQWYLEEFSLQGQVVDTFLNEDVAVADASRHSDVMVENTLYTSGDLLTKAVADSGIDDARTYNSTFFTFTPPDAPRALAGGEATAVTVPFSQNYISYFDYNPASGLYEMSQSNTATGAEKETTIDGGTGEELAFSNVLVLFAEMPVYDNTDVLLNIQFGYGGVGYYFNGGAWEQVRWMKDSPMHTLQILAADGSETPVSLNCGTSYVAFVDVENAGETAYGTDAGQTKLG